MRKKSVLILVVVALLACGGTAFSVFAKGPNTQATSTTYAGRLSSIAHTYFRMKSTVSLKRILSPNAANTTPSGFTPAQLRKAYGLDQLTNDGTGITVAIVDAYGNPNAQADLNTYDTTFGLPATTITVVYPQGKPTGTIDAGWALETNLDIQMVHTSAPKAKIVLEAAVSPTLANLFAAAKDAYTQRKATIVSMSFGGGEFQGETGSTNDGILAAGVKMGVSFTASSGDSGTGAQYPAASQYVTAVGGTSLITQPNGAYANETAWSGSGGGVSQYETRPAYQNGFNTNTMRSIPDVAMVADPATGVVVYDSFAYSGQTGFFILGGTSASAPLFAGVLALANQSRKASFKNADIQIYKIAQTKYATDFHDIVSGTNGNCGKVCTAVTGYDDVTGLGSPISTPLVRDLIATP